MIFVILYLYTTWRGCDCIESLWNICFNICQCEGVCPMQQKTIPVEIIKVSLSRVSEEQLWLITLACRSFKQFAVGLFLKFGDSNTSCLGRVTESYWRILSRVLHAFLSFSILQQTYHSFCNNLTHFVFVLPFNWWVNKYTGLHKLSTYYQNLDILNSDFQWFIDFKYVGNSCQ